MADDTQLPAPTDNAGLRALVSNVPVAAGSLAPRNLAEVMDFGQLMAKAGPMVGKAFRNNPGACVAITMQAMQWNMSPFAVSQKAYVTNDNIAYEAQLVTAVINAHAPVSERPQYEFSGDRGTTRKCTITATLRGDTKPSIYTSPEVSKITTKNSPLWKTDEDQQLGYYSIRAWARRYCPEIIMGVYTPDELPDDRGVVASQPVYDEFDQRPADERTQDETSGGGIFLSGEPKDLVVAHTTGLLKACETVEDIQRVWASFKRKYYNNTTKKLSLLTFQGMEIIFDEERERVAKAAGIVPWLLSFIDGAKDLSELEAWRASEAIEVAFTGLSEDQGAQVERAYEDKQEALAAAIKNEIDAQRAVSA